MKFVAKITAVLTFVFLASCTQKPTHTLYVINMSGDKEKIADFYQNSQGLNDCNTLKARWTENYSPTCVSH